MYIYIEVFSCTVGIALIRGLSLVSDDALTNYSYLNINAEVSINLFLTRCLSGLGPSGNDNGILGGLYFNGSRIPNSRYIGCNAASRIIKVDPGAVNAGIINMQQCKELSTTTEGVYTYVMLNSSRMNESLSVGLYFTGRSESLDLHNIYPIT